MGWKRTLYIMFFAQLVTAMGFSSIFPFLPLYVKSLGASTSLSIELLAGLVFSGQAISMAIASPIWGAMADRYGRKMMVMRSMFGGVVILMWMGFVNSAEELVILRFIQGFITGTVSAANALIAAETPRKHMGYAMGLLQVGLGSGVALGPVLGGVMADLYGYQSAFYVTSVLMLLAGILVWVGVKEDFTPPEKTDKSSSGLAKWKAILTGPGVMMTYGMRFMILLGRMMITPIAPLFIGTLLVVGQALNTYTGFVIGVAAATTTISSIYLGRLGDRVGHRKIAIISTFFAAVFYLPQFLVTDVWQLLIMQALVGVAMGGVIPAISALLAAYTKQGEEGAVYGLDNSINAIARAIAPMLGAGLAFVFGLRSTFLFTSLMLFIAGALAWWLLPKPGSRPSQEEVGMSKSSNMDYK
jgi:DHA1 family multidrug resistance protein-like MFS transporter